MSETKRDANKLNIKELKNLDKKVSSLIESLRNTIIEDLKKGKMNDEAVESLSKTEKYQDEIRLNISEINTRFIKESHYKFCLKIQRKYSFKRIEYLEEFLDENRESFDKFINSKSRDNNHDL